MPTRFPTTAVQAHYQALLAGQPPVITVEPTGGSFYTGRVLTLVVGATGAGRVYQWYKDGNAVSGATNWTLNFGYLDATNSGTYHVTVTNSAGSTNSSSAVVQVGNDLARYQAAVRGEVGLISYYTFDASDAADTKGTNSGSLVGNVTFSAGVGQGTDHGGRAGRRFPHRLGAGIGVRVRQRHGDS